MRAMNSGAMNFSLMNLSLINARSMTVSACYNPCHGKITPKKTAADLDRVSRDLAQCTRAFGFPRLVQDGRSIEDDRNLFGQRHPVDLKRGSQHHRWKKSRRAIFCRRAIDRLAAAPSGALSVLPDACGHLRLACTFEPAVCDPERTRSVSVAFLPFPIPPVFLVSGPSARPSCRPLMVDC